jgi:hypothetical protein
VPRFARNDAGKVTTLFFVTAKNFPVIARNFPVIALFSRHREERSDP